MRLTIVLFLFSLPAFAEPPLTVVLFQNWHDPKEGAFTVNVPQGWRISGGASRRAAVDIRHVVRADDPTGRIRIFLDDPDIVPRQVPDAMMTSMGLREGQTMQAAWGAPILLQRYRPGADYSRDYTKARLCSTPEFTGGGELMAETADVTREAAGLAASQVSAQASAGDAYFRCAADYGYVDSTTIVAGPRVGRGAVIWSVLHMSGFLVKSQADVPYAMYILHMMDSSFKLDPEWEARSQRDTQALTVAVTRAQNAMMNNLARQSASRASQERSSVVGQKSFDVMAGWNARNKTMDRVFDKDTQVRRGVTTTEDPVWGSRTVSNDYNYYWTRPDGSIVGTRTDSPPAVGGGGWRMVTNQ